MKRFELLIECFGDRDVICDTSIYPLIVFFLNICRKASWERNCVVVEYSFDMDVVVRVASEYILLMFVYLVFLLSRLG